MDRRQFLKQAAGFGAALTVPFVFSDKLFDGKEDSLWVNW